MNDGLEQRKTLIKRKFSLLLNTLESSLNEDIYKKVFGIMLNSFTNIHKILFVKNIKTLYLYNTELQILINNYGESNIFSGLGKHRFISILRDNIQTLINHTIYIKKTFGIIKFKENIFEITQTKIFSIFDGEEDIQIYLNISIPFDKLLKEGNGGFFIKIYSVKKPIFSTVFFIGEDEIFISNFQKAKGIEDYMFLINYHKITLYLICLIANKLGKHKIRSYSNENHPSKFESEHGGFVGNYDDICLSYNMQKNEEHFFIGNIENIYINMSEIIKNNIKNIITKNIF